MKWNSKVISWKKCFLSDPHKTAVFICKACKLGTDVDHNNSPAIVETMQPGELVWQTRPNCSVAPIMSVTRVKVTTSDPRV